MSRRHGRFVAAIDQGTTSTRCLVFDHGGRMVAVDQHEHRQHYPQPGWAEHDAAEIWRNTLRVLPGALDSAGLQPSDLAAVGIANQRETTVVWERATGRPVAPAITWQDTRSAALIEELNRGPTAQLFHEVCGLTPAGYFAAPRLRWLLDHVPGLQRRARTGEIAFGTIESWLIWNLTGGPDGGVHVTDVTNASRTLLMDIRTLDWDQRLLDALDIPRELLPEVRPNAQVYGECVVGLPGVPIGGAFGDQQAALFGQTCFAAGEAKCTYGTGAFLLMNTGDQVPTSSHGLISTVAFALEGQPPVYASEGSIAVAGALVQWFRDALEMIRSAPEIETLARRVDDNGGCYIVPAFAGLFAPRWQPDARGVVVGLTSYVTRSHLARAVLEATAWQTAEVVEAMSADTGIAFTGLKVDGGMTANHLLMQIVADVLAVPVERPLVAESVSLGAAYAAGLAVGYWPDLEGLRDNWHQAAVWQPAMSEAVRRRERDSWDHAVQRTLHWVREDADRRP
ncbi:glycerol kinase GlpK [Nocardioides marinquilinus]|uniref:Glycerol kinase n=1 Tax=Nocardioides marinquilinus TaxID=1210400 RepID=A0ABP9PVX5_9ACTN